MMNKEEPDLDVPVTSKSPAESSGGAETSSSAIQTTPPTTTTLDTPSAPAVTSSQIDSEYSVLSESKSQPPQCRPPKKQSAWRRILAILTWQPHRVRWDSANPPKFTIALNILFAFAGAFTVANLYYSHAILNVLARDFGVSNEQASHIPTLAQGGYATGLLLLNPLGDVFKRRAFTLALVWVTATLWIGLCLTNSFTTFTVISYLTGITTVTPQIMLPLVGDLAPPDRRAAALSIVGSGNLLGILVARLLSGIVANYTSWRNIYWIAFALQYVILFLLWLFMPDYPATNSSLNYFGMLWSMVKMLRKHPVLVQACLIAFCCTAPFTGYWTTLTFLLSSPPYNYSPLPIGLWALIGIAGIVLVPLFARRVIDGFVPLFSTVLGIFVALVGQIIGTYTGLLSVAGPALQAFLLDLGLMSLQIANRSSIYSCEPNARNRINTVYMLATFLGQITGTSAGNKLYATGGWVASGSLSVAFLVLAVAVCAARGPWQTGWFGWSGGARLRKKENMSANGFTQERAHHTGVIEKVEDAQGVDGEDGGREMTNTQRALEEMAGEDEEEQEISEVELRRQPGI